MDKQARSHRAGPKSNKRKPSHQREVGLSSGGTKVRDVFDNRPTLEEWDTSRKVSKYVTYSPEIAEKVADLVAQGYTVAEIAKLKGMPGTSAVWSWMATQEHFADRMKVARAAAMYALADQMLTIADAATPEDVQVAKLRIETRQWIMAKYNRGQFGDKVEVEGSGGGKLVIAWQGDGDASKPPRVLDGVVTRSPVAGPVAGDDATDITPST